MSDKGARRVNQVQIDLACLFGRSEHVQINKISRACLWQDSKTSGQK